MTAAIAAFGVLVLALGALGLVRPAALMALVDRPWKSPTGLHVAVAFRAGLGVLLVAGSAETRFPTVVAALGALSLVSAAALPFIGFARARRFIDWWMARPPGFVRVWSLAALVFGAFLVYAAA